jgi:hypothetical protein
MLALESYARSRPVCWPGNAALAADCGCSEREIRRRLEALEAAGWIVRVRDRRGRLQSRAGIALLRRLSTGLAVVKSGLSQEQLLDLVVARRTEAPPTDRNVRPPTDRTGRRNQEGTKREKKAAAASVPGTPAPARTPPGDWHRRRPASAAVELALALAVRPAGPGSPARRLASTLGPPPSARRSRDAELARFEAWRAARAGT